MNALLEKISSQSVQEVCSASGFFHGCLKIHSAQIQSFLSHMRVWFRLNFMRLCMPDNYCQLEWVQLWHFQLTIASSYLEQKLYSKKFLNSNIFLFFMASQFKKYKSNDPKVWLYVIIVLSCSKKLPSEMDFGILEFVLFKFFYLYILKISWSYPF